MNINFRAGYGNYQLSKPKQKEVPKENTEITLDGVNSENNVQKGTISVSWESTKVITRGGSTLIATDSGSYTVVRGTQPSDNGVVSPQAVEALKVNTMNFRQI